MIKNSVHNTNQDNPSVVNNRISQFFDIQV